MHDIKYAVKHKNLLPLYLANSEYINNLGENKGNPLYQPLADGKANEIIY